MGRGAPQFYWPPNGVSDDARSLYPGYVSDSGAFVCPATRNVVLQESHLTDNDVDGRVGSNGAHSYELFGFYSNGPNVLERKTTTNVMPNPEQIVLVLDGDGDVGINNYPDPTDNHGAAGWNWGFSDGHGAWVTASGTATALSASYH